MKNNFIEDDDNEDNVIYLKQNRMERYTPADWIEDEIKDGSSFEEILEEFDLTPGEVFEILLNIGMIDSDRLRVMLDVE